MDLHPSVELKLGAEPEADDGRGFLLAAKHPRRYIRNTRQLVGIRRRTGRPLYGFPTRAQLAWNINRHMNITATYLYFSPDDFLRQAQPDRPVNFVAALLSYRF